MVSHRVGNSEDLRARQTAFRLRRAETLVDRLNRTVGPHRFTGSRLLTTGREDSSEWDSLGGPRDLRLSLAPKRRGGPPLGHPSLAERSLPCPRDAATAPNSSPSVGRRPRLCRDVDGLEPPRPRGWSREHCWPWRL